MILNLPLMSNNITRDDLDCVIEFLKGDPILTQSKNVQAFEKEWSEWLGVKHSVFVNSGSSANILTMAALRQLYGPGEVIVPALTWVSDITSVLYAGLTPVFVDINRRNLAMAEDEVLKRITPQTRAVFLTHILGFNGLSDRLLKELSQRNIKLIEDVCESHGASFNGRRLGAYGFASNFSYYYAHHMSTIEGGMVCTNDEEFYQTIRMMRSHGMLRESTDETLKSHIKAKHADLNSDFIFVHPGYNMRSTEINAVMGRNQLKRLDANNDKRVRNFETFLEHLNDRLFVRDYDTQGAVNYAFTLLMKDADPGLRDRLENRMRAAKIEFRRGMSGGGNQLRQPYLKNVMTTNPEDFPQTEHVHFFGFYIGNYPDLEKQKIIQLCDILNSVS